MTLCLNFQNRLKGPVAGGSSRAEGHGKEFRVELRQLPARRTQLLNSLRRLRWEKLETEGRGKFLLRFHFYSPG